MNRCLGEHWDISAPLNRTWKPWVKASFSALSDKLALTRLCILATPYTDRVFSSTQITLPCPHWLPEDCIFFPTELFGCFKKKWLVFDNLESTWQNFLWDRLKNSLAEMKAWRCMHLSNYFIKIVRTLRKNF